MFHYKVDRHRTPREAGRELLLETRGWADDFIARHAEAPPEKALALAEAATGWLPLLYFQPDHPGRDYLARWRDQTAEAHLADGLWREGYWRVADVAFGMRHFTGFLAAFARLDPADPVTVGQLVQAAQLLGNWHPAVPSWYDHETALFRSETLGTDGPGEPGPCVPAHFHAVALALAAYRATRATRYRQLALTHAGRWADALLASEELPVALEASGPLYDLPARESALSPREETVARAEEFLAADAIESLLKCWKLANEDRFLRAAERLLDALAPELSDPEAAPLAAAIRFYRRIAKSDRYDEAVRAERQRLDLEGVEVLDLDLAPLYDARPPGIGKAADLPRWREDGQVAQHNPVTLALAAEVDQDPVLATRALDLARAALSLAREAFPSVPAELGSARSVAAIARGHTRSNGAGVVTEVLVPLMARFK